MEASAGIMIESKVINNKENIQTSAQPSRDALVDMPSTAENTKFCIESKLQDFMNRTDSKLEMWMKQASNEIHKFQANSKKEDHSVGYECENCEVLRSQCDAVLKLNIDREKELLSLKEELKRKDKIIGSLQKETKCLTKELTCKNKRLTDLRSVNHTGFEAKIVQLQIITSKQNLQLSALQEQNKMLSAQNKLKDRIVFSKQNELNVMSEEMKKRETRRSISYDSFTRLKLQLKNNLPEHQGDGEWSSCSGDIVIIHDLVQKQINLKLLHNSKIRVREMWAKTLKDVLICVREMKIQPRAVILRAGNADVMEASEDEILKTIKDIYQNLHRKNIKLVWSNLVPQSDDFETNSKIYFVNLKVNKELTSKPGAYIDRNEHFYMRDILHPSILDVLID